MGKYNRSDIVRGQKTLANGAVAGFVIDDQGREVFRIIEGGNPPTGAQRKHKSISPAKAQAAFNKYWGARRSAAFGNPKKLRAVNAAKKRDLAYGSPSRKVSTRTYLANPGRYDFEGVDFGAKRYPKATGKRLSALNANRAKLGAKGSATRKAAARKAAATRAANRAAVKGMSRDKKAASPKQLAALKKARAARKQKGGSVSPAAARAAFTKYWRARLNNSRY